jgi:hypothetical protein
MEPEEWGDIATWASARSAELPLLSAPWPVRIQPAELAALDAECGRVDWDTLPGPSAGGFAILWGSIRQAAGQSGAGLEFAPDAFDEAADVKPPGSTLTDE